MGLSGKNNVKLTPLKLMVSETGIVSGTGQSFSRQTATGGAYVFMSLNGGNQGLLEQSYAQLKDSVYDGLVLQTRLKPHLDQISLSIDERIDANGILSANDENWRRVV